MTSSRLFSEIRFSPKMVGPEVSLGLGLSVIRRAATTSGGRSPPAAGLGCGGSCPGRRVTRAPLRSAAGTRSGAGGRWIWVLDGGRPKPPAEGLRAAAGWAGSVGRWSAAAGWAGSVGRWSAAAGRAGSVGPCSPAAGWPGAAGALPLPAGSGNLPPASAGGALGRSVTGCSCSCGCGGWRGWLAWAGGGWRGRSAGAGGGWLGWPA